MKFSIFSWILMQGVLSFSQNNAIKGLISNPDTRILYRGYDNPLEIYTCEVCDSVYVSSADAEVTMRNKGQFYVRPKAGKRNLTLSIKCILGSDTTSLWSERYIIKALPKPKIYLGGIAMNKDFNHVKETNLFHQNRFSVRYDESVHLTGVKFRILEWSINIGKTTFTNTDAKLTDDFKAAFKKAKKGTRVYFDNVTIIAPDGIARKVKMDQTYIKKVKRNTDYEPDPDGNRWRNPVSG